MNRTIPLPQWVAFAAATAFLLPMGAEAADFWIDPAASVAAPDGSPGAPWPSLQHVIEAGLIQSRAPASFPYVTGGALVAKNAGAPVQPGDTLWLKSGFHGRIFIQSYHNAAPIQIRAAPGEVPRVSQLVLQASSQWHVSGLSISPFHAPAGATPGRNQAMVFVQSHDWQGPAHDITIEGCEVFTSHNTSTWDAPTWVRSAYDAVITQGQHVTIEGMHLHDIRFGVQVHGEHSIVRNNRIERFTGDGMRAIADDGLYEGNYVRHALAVDDNHDDGFQAWSLGPNNVPGNGVIRRVTVRNNRFEHFEPSDTRFRDNFQGIGCFDGFFDEFVIENNVVIVDSWHGITLAGTRDSRIINNTIIKADPAGQRTPAVWVRDHKDGRPSARVLLRNNLSTLFNYGTGTMQDHNLQYTNPGIHFVDPTAGDYHLLATSPAIDVGSAVGAPLIDIEGTVRPQGSGVDLGAYEYATAPPPADAGYPDAEPLDASPQDAGTPDQGAADAGSQDSGAPSHLDAAVDAGQGSAPDAHAPQVDGGVMPGDTGTLAADAAPPTPDASITSLNDSGSGCGCTTRAKHREDTSPLSALALLGLLLMRRRT